MDGAIAHLQEIDVPCDDARCIAGGSPKRDSVLVLERRDGVFGRPDRNLDCNGDAVVSEHEFLQGLMAQLVVPNRWDDESGCIGCGVLFAVHDDARDVGEFGMRLGRRGFRVVIAAE